MGVSAVPDPACPGCLGDGKCWVCLGVGRLRRPASFTVDCHVCQGSGRCASCTPETDSVQPTRRSRPSGPFGVGLAVSG
jgi:hypothetical protein